MTELKRRLKFFLSLFFCLTLAGTLGFMGLEDLSLFEAFYYNIVTMSTVGYGDIYPTTPESRVFAILIITLGGATFLGVVANATELLILRRETHNRERKVNMVLGIFFSEIGYQLIDRFSRLDRNIHTLRPHLILDMSWRKKEFSSAGRAMGDHIVNLSVTPKDLQAFHTLFLSKRQFFIDLIENPVLVEHEAFSEVLLALFHLMDELDAREDFSCLPKPDLIHLSGDFNRAYKGLALQWLSYLGHLKENYAYLYSLAARKNPFNPKATPVVKE